MLIGICGGICAGKNSIADFLVKEHGFKRAAIDNPSWPSPRTDDSTIFPSFDSLLLAVTKAWHQRWVLANIVDEQALEKLLRRPFFLFISIDAPVSLRWQRFKDRCIGEKKKPPSLEDFVLRSDKQFFDSGVGLAHLLGRAQLRLLNPSKSKPELWASLRALNLANDDRLRPSWDEYFMQLADLAAQRSNCMKRRVGCVLVREKRVISTGYNGTPRNVKNCNRGGCPRCNVGEHAGTGLATCLCIHAEENALLEAGRERIREGAILYCNTCPCLTCSVKIAQVGITEVIFSQSYNLDEMAASVLKEAGVKLRQFSSPPNGLVDLDGIQA